MPSIGFHVHMAVSLGFALLWVPCCSEALQSECAASVSSRFAASGWPKKLDWGIYWFGPGDETEKAIAGKKSSLYDPSKNTLLYFHGWTGGHGGSTRNCERVTTRCTEVECPGTDGQLLMAERWLQDGWNVGFFYWDQFADEECSRDAEQKIWFDRHGDGFRWKSFDAETGDLTDHYFTDNTVSLTDLCVRSVHDALGDFKGSHVRFVGHSLGAQLAVRCASALHEERHPAAPQRLALLEPFFTTHHTDLILCHKLDTGEGLGSFTAAATVRYVNELWKEKKVVTEVYKSSVLTELEEFGNPNKQLARFGTLVQYEPHWCGSIGMGMLEKVERVEEFRNVECKHIAVFPIYFWNYKLAPPALELLPQSDVTGAEAGSAVKSCSTPSAACTDGQIHEWIERNILLGGGQLWVQRGGRSTFNTSDDTFELSPGLDHLSYGVQRHAMSFADVRAQQHSEPWWHQRFYAVVVPAATLLGLGALLGVGVRVSLFCVKQRSSGEISGSSDEEQADVTSSRQPMVTAREFQVKGNFEDNHACPCTEDGI